MTRRWGGLAAAALFALSGCHSSSDTPVSRPTEAEAREVLAQYVAQANSTNSGKDFCAVSFLGEACEQDYVQARGDTTKPTAPPTVLLSRVGGPTTFVLVVCGTNGESRSYRSDFPVEREGGELRAVIPVFWAGTTFSGERTDGAFTVGASPSPRPMGC